MILRAHATFGRPGRETASRTEPTFAREPDRGRDKLPLRPQLANVL